MFSLIIASAGLIILSVTGYITFIHWLDKTIKKAVTSGKDVQPLYANSNNSITKTNNLNNFKKKYICQVKKHTEKC